MATGPDLNRRRRQTLERIAPGAEVEEREGSRVSVTLSGEVAVFHRPPPTPDTKQRAVASVRPFPELTGNTP